MKHYSEKPATDGIRRRSNAIKTFKLVKEPEDLIISVRSEANTEPAGIIINEPEDNVISPVINEIQELYATKRSRRRFVLGGIITGLATILLGTISLTIFFARVTITIKPRVESISLNNLLVALDTSVSKNLIQQKVVPAELLEFSRKVQSEFESTGKEFVEDKAHGKVLIYNRFSSAPQTLVENTRFLTDSGLLFRLIKTVTVPGAKIKEGKIVPESVEAELIADTAGENFNISGKINLNIPGFKNTAKYDGFYAVAVDGSSGGFRGQTQVISKDDIKKAEEQVTKQIFEELKQEVSKKIPVGFKFLDSLREIQIIKVTSPRERTRNNRFTVEAEAHAKTLVFRQEDIQKILLDFVNKQDGDMELIQDSLDLQYQAQEVDYAKGYAKIIVRGNAKKKAKGLKDKIMQMVLGKKEGSIVESLKTHTGLASFTVSFFPPWIFSAPTDSEKIRVIENN